MRVKKSKKLSAREGICPICGRPLDKWNGQELCSNCGYVKQGGVFVDYISVEEFKKQSEKVQETLLEWWKENVKQYDIFYRKSEVGFDWNGRQKYIVVKTKGYKLETITLRNRKISGGRDAWTESWNIECIWDIIPLLTETHLRKFIEDKDYKYIGINNFLESEGKQWNIKIFKSMMQFEPDMEFYCDTPLECYWTAACEVASE